MTVQELMRALGKLPKDMPVVKPNFDDDDESYLGQLDYVIIEEQASYWDSEQNNHYGSVVVLG
jgi:hypothetical protein